MANLTHVEIERIAQASGFPAMAEWRIGNDSKVYKVGSPELEEAKDRIGLGPTVSVSNIMATIAMRESQGNPRAHNPVPPDNSYGLWQINMLAHSKSYLGISKNEDLYDPYVNGRAALKIFNDSANGSGKPAYSAGWLMEGLDPWTTRNAALKDLYKRGASVGSNTHEAGLYPGQLGLEGALGSATDILGKLTALFNPTFWKWVGLGALGIFIVLIATVMFSDTGQSAAKAAVTKGVVK